VRADEDVDLAGGEVGEDATLFGGRTEARHHLDRHGKVVEALPERHVVLLGEDRRGDEHERLFARLGGLEGGADGDLRLAVADVAADETVHRVRRLHVVLDVVDGLGLVLGLLEGKGVLEPPHELAVGWEGVAGDRLAGGVELEELTGHLDDRPAGPRLDGRPARAAEPVERRHPGAGADVPADLADLLVRDEDAVLALVLEQQVVARDASDGARLDAGEAGDAVVLVDDVVPGAHVEEGREAGAADEAPLARRTAQQRALGHDGELELGREEALAQRRGDEVEAGRGGAVPLELLGREDLGREVTQPVGRALGLTLVAEDDEDAVAVAHQTHEVALGAGEVAGGELRARGLEADWLVTLHEVDVERLGEEGAGLRERHVEPLASAARLFCASLAPIPSAEHRVELGAEVGEGAHDFVGVEHGDALSTLGDELFEGRETPGERRQGAHAGVPVEIVRRLLATLGLPAADRLVHPRLILGEIGIGLEGGEDRRLVPRPGRTLRVHRERADGVDLVAPELDAQRIAERRVDVDQAATHSELATLAHLVLDPVVAKVCKATDDDVEAGGRSTGRHLLAHPERDRARLQLERHEALEQSHCLGDDHPTGGERGERLLALADDVRRRRHVGAVEDATRRQHRHLALQVDAELGCQLRRRLAVRGDDQPTRAAGLPDSGHAAFRRPTPLPAALRHDRGRQHVRREERRRVDGGGAAELRRRRREPLTRQDVVEQHIRLRP